MKKYLAIYSDNGIITGEEFDKKNEAISRCRDFPYIGKQFSICVIRKDKNYTEVWKNSMLKIDLNFCYDLIKIKKPDC